MTLVCCPKVEDTKTVIRLKNWHLGIWTALINALSEPFIKFSLIRKKEGQGKGHYCCKIH